MKKLPAVAAPSKVLSWLSLLRPGLQPLGSQLPGAFRRDSAEPFWKSVTQVEVCLDPSEVDPAHLHPSPATSKSPHTPYTQKTTL